MDQSRKKLLHDNTREEIKSIAWKQISGTGASALSLGAVARELHVTPPALYRYFPSRDDLVTALIGDAYLSFVETLEAGRDAVPAEDHADRFRSLCMAYHAWAAAHPQQYILIFGTPVPGYKLDPGVGQVADRSFVVLLDLLNAAAEAGHLGFTLKNIPLSEALRRRLKAASAQGKSYPARVMYLALLSWSFIHGVTSLELYGRYGGILGDQTDPFILLEIERFIKYIDLL